jgi:hypothetical protein
MRLPGFINHKKGGKFRTIIRPELSNGVEYCDDEWVEVFGELKPEEVVVNIQTPFQERPVKKRTIRDITRKTYVNVEDNCIFQKVIAMNQVDALMRLSGLPEVAGETYSLRNSSGGKHMNIYINNKSSSCFIDIISNHIFVPRGSGRGSPNIIQWLMWYQPAWTGLDLAKFLKKTFSDL